MVFGGELASELASGLAKGTGNLSSGFLQKKQQWHGSIIAAVPLLLLLCAEFSGYAPRAVTPTPYPPLLPTRLWLVCETTERISPGWGAGEFRHRLFLLDSFVFCLVRHP